MSSLVQMLEADGFTGKLTCGDHAHLALRDGQLVGAAWPDLEPFDAAVVLMSMTTGIAEVDDDAPDEAGPPLMDLITLVLESARLADDWAALAPRVLKVEGDVAGASEPVRAVCAHLDGRRTVDEAIREAGLLPIRCVDGLLQLVDDRVLRSAGRARPDDVVARSLAWQPGDAQARMEEGRATTLDVAAPTTAPVAAAPPEPPDDASFYDLLDESRRALRGKDYQSAHDILVRAQSIRPDDRTVGQNLRRIRQLMGA